MSVKVITLSALFALAQARFGQEQIPVAAIAAVQGGSPGVAQTIAGAAVSDNLAATNPCNKLARGDQILAELGTGADAVAAAIGMVSSEKNFNPFAVSIPVVCNDPSLPQNPLIRGITPLIDPAVVGSDIANALSAQTKASPITNNAGMSIADLLKANKFTNFTSAAPDATTNAIEPGAAGGAAVGQVASSASSAAAAAAATSAVAAVVDCGAAVGR
jgi:hypothetical protein